MPGTVAFLRMTRSPLGILAGTGFYDLDALQDTSEQTVTTPFGDALVTRGTWHGIPVVFLARHGAGHAIPPHLVNYRANIRALVDLGVRDVVAVNVTGSIDPDLRPGDLLCLDDFLDLTRQRPLTFFDGTGPEGVVHTDVLEPYHPALRREILDAGAATGRSVRDGGVYACFEGPRFETRAEIRLARLAGADVAGMTGVPEVTLAAEAGLRYAAISPRRQPRERRRRHRRAHHHGRDRRGPARNGQRRPRRPRRARPHPRHLPRHRPRRRAPRMSRVRIENASYVVTVDDDDRILRDTTVTIENGVITAIEAGATGRRSATTAPEPEAERDPLRGRWLGLAGARESAQRASVRMVGGRTTDPAEPHGATEVAPPTTRSSSTPGASS